MNIELRPLRDFEEDAFVRENQIAFDKAAVEEFGPQKESVIPREHIVSSIHAENAEAFRIIVDGEPVGGVVVAIPVTVLFMCLQRYYVEGVTGGAVKG